MPNLKYFSLPLLFCLLLSCKDKDSNDNNKQIALVEESPKEIVIIFNNAPEQQVISAPSGAGFSTFFKDIGFFYDHSDTKTVSPKRSTPNDTIIIEPKDDKIELNLENGKYDFFTFLLKKGDTITINYDGITPIASSKSYHYIDLNFDSYLNEKLEYDYSEKIKFLHPLPFMSFIDKKDSRDYKTRFKEFKSKNGELMLKRLNDEQKLIDSLYKSGNLSELSYNYRNNRIKLYTQHYNIEHDSLSNAEIDSLLFNSDDKLHVKIYRDLLTKLISVRYRLRSINGDNKFYGKDNKQAFDSILNSKKIGQKTKDYLLHENLKLINQNFTQEDFKHYYALFASNVNNPSMIENIKQKFLIDYEELRKETNNVILTDLNNSKKYLDTIITSNKGKLIYVDFWASWCAPCIAAMPDSRRLQKEFREDNIVFMYISIDKDLDKWKKASQSEGLINYDNSYLSINYPAAKFYERLKMNTIPRYLLYDHNGNLIYQNAPSPTSKDIRNVIKKHLSEIN